MTTQKDQLEYDVMERKRELWGHLKLFNEGRSDRYVLKDYKGNEPEEELLKWFLQADRDDVIGRIKGKDDRYAFLYYR